MITSRLLKKNKIAFFCAVLFLFSSVPVYANSGYIYNTLNEQCQEIIRNINEEYSMSISVTLPDVNTISVSTELDEFVAEFKRIMTEYAESRRVAELIEQVAVLTQNDQETETVIIGEPWGNKTFSTYAYGRDSFSSQFYCTVTAYLYYEPYYYYVNSLNDVSYANAQLVNTGLTSPYYRLNNFSKSLSSGGRVINITYNGVLTGYYLIGSVPVYFEDTNYNFTTVFNV